MIKRIYDMKRRKAYTFQVVGFILSAALLLVGASRGTALAQTAEAATSVPGYILVRMHINDHEAFFSKYGAVVGPTIQAHQGRAIVASASPEILEGQWGNNWTVVLEFPSVEAAKAWYNSAEYQKAIPFRHAASEYTNMVVLEGFTGLPPTPGSKSE